ncbi:MAG: nitronate monooxygenase [Planctomycetota bacterium]|jgi:nitronate monooxygenase
MNIQNLEIPILQAPVESTAKLTAAVSNTGAMGSLGLAWRDADTAARLVDEVLAKTQNPFFANFVLAFDALAFDAVIEAGVPAITLSWGISSDLINRAHCHGVQVGVQVGTVDGAKDSISKGADFIICQGIEAGGHVQSTTKLSRLLPQVIDCANGVPVIAAGGLADKDDVNWALGEGATAAMLGTRFVATQESDAHPLYKAAILAAKGSDTVSTTCFDGGWPNATHRVIRNQLFNAWESAGCPQPGSRPGENLLLTEDSSGYEIRKYHFSNPMKDFSISDVSDWCLYAGLGCDRIKDIPSVTELIDRLWSK